MEEQEILLQLNNVFRKCFKRQDITVSPETSAADVTGWDSLTHMILINDIERHFSIKFKLMEIMKFNNVGDMLACIKKKVNT